MSIWNSCRIKSNVFTFPTYKRSLTLHDNNFAIGGTQTYLPIYYLQYHVYPFHPAIPIHPNLQYFDRVFITRVERGQCFQVGHLLGHPAISRFYWIKTQSYHIRRGSSLFQILCIWEAKTMSCQKDLSQENLKKKFQAH